MKTFLIKNGNVFYKNKIQKMDLLIVNNKITKIQKNINDSCKNVIDAKNLTVIPGLIDVHVHLRQPGFEYKETITSGSMAAAAGGFTTICAMPNVSPPLDNVIELKKQLALIKKQALINVLPYSAITIGRTGHGKLVNFAKNKKYCFAFSDDGSGICDETLMDQAMQKVHAIDSHIVAHCEDLKLVNGGCIHDGLYAKKNGFKPISSQSEYLQIAKDVKLAIKNKCKYHVCHISTKQGVQIINNANNNLISCEVTPHHLLLNDTNLKDSGDFKMNPPLRSIADQKALIAGIKNKTIKIIASDHAPHSLEEKNKGLKNSAFGISSIEFSFPLLYTNLVLAKIINFKSLIDLMSFNANKIFGLPSNEIKTGNTANLALVDLINKRKIDKTKMISKGNSTPFDQWECCGWPVITICKGKIVYAK